MNLIIFGTGGQSKEIIGYMDGPWREAGHKLLGAVSTEPFHDDQFEFTVWDCVPEAMDFHDVGYIMGVVDPDLKRKFVADNLDRWVNVIHPTCLVSKYAKIGRGCVFAPYSTVLGNAIIGNFVNFNIHCESGHDTRIEDFCCLSPYSNINGGAVLEAGVFLGADAHVMPKVTMGTWSKASAGAIVRKSVPEFVTVYGDPAKPR